MFKVQILNLPIHGIHFHVFFKFTLFLKTLNWLELERARACVEGGIQFSLPMGECIAKIYKLPLNLANTSMLY